MQKWLSFQKMVQMYYQQLFRSARASTNRDLAAYQDTWYDWYIKHDQKFGY